MAGPLSTKPDLYRHFLRKWFDEAMAKGAKHIDVNALDLYTAAGSKLADRQVTTCCKIMLQEAGRWADVISPGKPADQGPKLTIRYFLPR